MCGERVREGLGLGDRRLAGPALGGDQGGVVPDRLAVLAPVEGEGPARQALAGIPLALAVMEQAPRSERLAKAADQLVRQAALGRPHGGDVPLRRLEIVDRDEGRLTAHGQAHVLRDEVGIDLLAEPVHRRPDILGIGLGHAGRLGHAGDAHPEVELGLGGLREAEIGAAER